MRLTHRVLTTIVAVAVWAVPALAQTRGGIMGDLLKDISDVESKLVGLAKGMPESAWTWRPGEGVRSTGEVLLHIAADNYLLPSMLGMTAPAETGITTDYKTAMAFEKKSLSRDAVLAELQKSFAFLKKSMSDTPDAKLDDAITVFGQKNTTRGMWILTTTHLHEHLGQLIAYARSNKVVPPWSK